MDSPRNVSLNYHNVLGNVNRFHGVSWALSFIRRRVEQAVTLSDHRTAALGEAFGVRIKELWLLARAVFVIDKEGVIRYTQVVRKTTREPDYAPILNRNSERIPRSLLRESVNAAKEWVSIKGGSNGANLGKGPVLCGVMRGLQ